MYEQKCKRKNWELVAIIIFKRWRNYIKAQFYYFGGELLLFVEQKKIACSGLQDPKMSSSSWALQETLSLTYKQSQMTKGLFPNTSFINPSLPRLRNWKKYKAHILNEHLESEDGLYEWQLLTLKINKK